MNVSLKDRERLKHIRIAILAIQDYTSGITKEKWEQEPMRYDVTLRQLEIVGEASIHISRELIDQNTDIPGHSVAGFRNIVVHEYLG